MCLICRSASWALRWSVARSESNAICLSSVASVYFWCSCWNCCHNSSTVPSIWIRSACLSSMSCKHRPTWIKIVYSTGVLMKFLKCIRLWTVPGFWCHHVHSDSPVWLHGLFQHSVVLRQKRLLPNTQFPADAASKFVPWKKLFIQSTVWMFERCFLSHSCCTLLMPYILHTGSWRKVISFNLLMLLLKSGLTINIYLT